MILNAGIFYHKATNDTKVTKSSALAMTCEMRLSRIWALSRLFLFCAFVLCAPIAQAQPCTEPDGVPGDLLYNNTHDVFQGCTARGWYAFHAPLSSAPPSGPSGCPNVGDVCTGAQAGIIYAGEYAGHKLYVTGADAPGTVITGGTGSGTYAWNDGTTNYLDLDNASMPNCPALSTARNTNRWSDQLNPACMDAQGEAFTAYLVNFSGTASPYKAASYCYHLGKVSDPSGPNNPLAHGRDDWYLPAVDELEFIYDSLKAGQPAGTHGFHNATYWSSTEYGTSSAWIQHFSDGTQYDNTKNSAYRVRCLRR